jgi:hypothetical protein
VEGILDAELLREERAVLSRNLRDENRSLAFGFVLFDQFGVCRRRGSANARGIDGFLSKSY